MALVVRSPFEGHKIGDQITDEKAIAAILDDHRADFVVRVAAPPAVALPEPAAPRE